LLVETAAGDTLRLPGKDWLVFQTRALFTRVEASVDQARIAKLNPVKLSVEVGPMASMLPVVAADEKTAQLDFCHDGLDALLVCVVLMTADNFELAELNDVLLSSGRDGMMKNVLRRVFACSHQTRLKLEQVIQRLSPVRCLIGDLSTPVVTAFIARCAPQSAMQ